MARLTKNTVFKTIPPRSETPMDKTTRAVREILDEETELREVKTGRLRKARLEREACTQAEAPKAARKKSAVKAAG